MVEINEIAEIQENVMKYIGNLFIEFTLFALYKTFLEQEEYQVANLSGIFNNL